MFPLLRRLPVRRIPWVGYSNFTTSYVLRSDTNDLLYEILNSKNQGKTNIQSYKGIQEKKRQYPKTKERKKRIVVNWSTGSDRAKEAANFVISDIFKLNYKGSIKVVNPATNRLEFVNIRDYAKGLDLTKHGLSIVNVDHAAKGVQVPLVKIVNSKIALKNYSNLLAQQKEEQLAELGFKKKTMDASKNDSSLKHVRVSWQITLDDLSKQKANEILSLLKRGNKVNLYLGDKDTSNSRDWMENFEHLEDAGKEMTHLPKREVERRDAILSKVWEIIDEYSISPIISGNTNSKMLIKLSPKPSILEKVDKRDLKEQKKRQRQEKLQQRIERKKQLIASN
ncbi:hypothetical protein KAFR_0F02000 [Kazachstania africana CBS 2517]|uniref:Altered inheritance of mitochondria protein 23, mitochondrial n=1 Tax=Kazachstania africana (strain ATCC 22294 / BCRC 22015 / CBS 2517 / CECT 1963 / NBRC 1671 / NRRL Y-8276) TaxID=1071382 RepID=H2AWP7_KAZAF|nr:hypothetical protein KAFR_0F02000 [Kazachstania africana CBS 2517]CCF58797.1 hypothetical protein KAFR_0F02000 [Kazachstania africana CBS 2517]